MIFYEAIKAIVHKKSGPMNDLFWRNETLKKELKNYTICKIAKFYVLTVKQTSDTENLIINAFHFV